MTPFKKGQQVTVKPGAFWCAGQQGTVLRHVPIRNAAGGWLVMLNDGSDIHLFFSHELEAA